ncbi:MAG: ATP-binding protein [Candidatus Caldarchaeum sp.]
MLFDIRPKERLEDLFGRREHFEELSRYVKRGLWVAVLGKRMTGKTSLVKTFANKVNGIYVNLMGVKGINGLVEKLASASGLKLEELRLSLQVAELKRSRITENVFAAYKDKVIVLDEVQEIASPHFLKLLKNLWDTYPKLRLVFTGSYMGVLKKLLEPAPTSPLYGRQPAKIVLEPFSRDMSVEFLRKGFEQLDIVPKAAELEEVVEKLNGYVGWLTYYGNFRCMRKLPHSKALNQTFKEGVKIMMQELDRFLENKKPETYLKVLKMAVFGVRWSEMAENLGINSKVLSDVVSRLVDVGFLEKDSGLYLVSDPLLRMAVKKIRI